MARYGGSSEDFDAEIAKLDELAQKHQALVAREQEYQRAQKATSGLESEVARTRATNNRSRVEAATVAEREGRVTGVEARNLNLTTEAIERNTAARLRSTQMRRVESATFAQASRGGRDPLFGQATELAGGPGGDISQYRLRRELGIGSGRASNLQSAVQLGLQPGSAGATGPLTRVVQETKNYQASLTDVERQFQAVRRANIEGVLTNLDSRTRAVNAATRQQAVEFGTVSQAMYKHGALTTEFIAAAARGETTLRDLGNQAIVTAGKFAGWSAAGAALYGAANAIGQVGHGAIASHDSVLQLQRVMKTGFDQQSAQTQISDLARQFNVPVDVAGDAVYRMGQRFHELPQAIEAARAALYSYKTGEVDVATSTENLIAITNGFGLSTDRLSSVYNQINQAQNTFGIKIGDTEAGLAKAAGTYHNAGGDLSYLLAVMTAIGRATNRSGTEIGTGVARAVNQIRQVSNIEKLTAQGVTVDPNNFQSTLQSALKAAQAPGADRQQIATGLFGNQYARLISPVLTDQTVLNKALRDTSPEKSKESAQKELAKVLKETDEQLAKVGVSLQTLGAELSQAGAFAGLGAGLKVVNAMLSGANELVGAFNHLPGPIREAVSLLGEAYITLLAMRRVGLTDRLIGTPLGAIFGGEDKRLATYAQRGGRDFVGEARNESEGASRAALRQQIAADIGQQELVKYRQGTFAASESLPEGHPERVAAEARLADLEQAQSLQSRRAAQYAQQAVAAKEVVVRAETELATLARLEGAELRAYLASIGAEIPRNISVPNTAGTAAVRTGGSGVSAAEVALGASAGEALHEGANAAEAQLRAQEDMARGIDRTSESIGELNTVVESTDIRDHITEPIKEVTRQTREQRGGTALRPENIVLDPEPGGRLAAPPSVTQKAVQGHTADLTRRLQSARDSLAETYKTLGRDVDESGKGARNVGQAGRVLGAAADRSIPLLAGAGGRVRAASSRLGGIAGGLRSTAASFASAFGPIDALVLAYIGLELLGNKLSEAAKKTQETTDEITKSTGTTEQFQRQLEENRKIARQTGPPTVGETLQNVGEDLNPVNLFSDVTGIGGYMSPAQRRQANADLAAKNAKATEDELRRKASQRSRGIAVGQEFPEEVRRDYKQNVDDVLHGITSLEGFRREMAQRAEEIKHSSHINPKQQAQLEEELAQARRQALGQVDPTAFGARFNGAGSEELRAAMGATSARLSSLGHRSTSFDFNELSAEYRRLSAQERSDPSYKTLQKLYADREAYYTAVENAAQADQDHILLNDHSHAGMVKAYQTRQRILTKRLPQADRGRVNDLQDQGRQLLSEREQQYQELAKIRKDEKNAPPVATAPELPGGGRAGGLHSGQDTGQQLEAKRAAVEKRIKQINDELKSTAHDLGKAQGDLRETLRRRADDLLKLRDDYFQARTTERESKLQVAVARTQDPGQQARTQVRSAQAQMADAEKTYGKDSNEYRQALTQLLQARQAVIQSAVQNIQAENNLLIAQAGTDPVAQANAGTQAARNLLAYMRSHASKFSKADITNQRAALLQAQNQQTETIRQNADQIAGLQGQLSIARAGSDAVAAARAAVSVAKGELSRAHNQAERLQAMIDLTQANNQLQDALVARTQATIDLSESRTQDPVEQARLEVEKARKGVSSSKGTDKLSARATLNRARQAYRNAKIDDKDSDINFNLEMGKISTDVAAQQIAALARVKGISKQKRQELLLEAKRLKDQSSQDYDINVGDIKLPSLYEVRRFVKGGQPNAQQQVTNAQNITVNVNRGEDVNDVARVFETTMGGPVGASIRNAGMG